MPSPSEVPNTFADRSDVSRNEEAMCDLLSRYRLVRVAEAKELGMQRPIAITL